MKAEQGKRYALIQDGRVHWKFDITTLPEWHDGLQVVDITGMSPEPDEGDLFDGTVFSKPVLSSVPSSRRSRLTALENVLITKGVVTRDEVETEFNR